MSPAIGRGAGPASLQRYNREFSSQRFWQCLLPAIHLILLPLTRCSRLKKLDCRQATLTFFSGQVKVPRGDHLEPRAGDAAGLDFMYMVPGGRSFESFRILLLLC